MSAWLCHNKTLSCVVDVIKSDDFKEYDKENYAEKSNEELINILSDLNTKSLNCRYGENEYHILQDREYIKLDVDDGQRYKSLSCYTYQTCECPENNNHPLFHALESWEIDNESKYETVWSQYHWDIDNPIF